MKKFAVLLLAFFAAFAVCASDLQQQALKGALDSAGESLKKAEFQGKKVTIYPISGDEGNLSKQLENILIGNGITCVVNRNDPDYDRLQEKKHLPGNSRAAQLFEELTRFGRAQSADIVIVGQVKDCHLIGKNGAYAEILLQAYDLNSKKYVWGGNFVCRKYQGEEVAGLVDLDAEVKNAITSGFKEIESSLKTSGKVNGKRKIIIIPLAGDVNNYVTDQTIQLISASGSIPVDIKFPTVDMAEAYLRDNKLSDYLVCYGSVRKLHKSTPVKFQRGNEYIVSYTVTAEIRLFISDPLTREVLWTDRVFVNETFESAAESVSAKEKLKQIPDEIANDVADNWRGIIWGLIITIAVLIIVVVGIKIFFSYNRIR